MTRLPSSISKLINELSKLPGIGPKTAQRLTFFLLKKERMDLQSLSSAIADLKQGVTFCSICHNMVEKDPCATCTDPMRDKSIICVVEEPLDALAIDKSESFKGVFHVLGGVLNPLEGIGPDQLKITSLVDRIMNHESGIMEVIIATNPSLEGETTAMHLAKVIKAVNPALKITRIARGLPTGGDLEYADDITLMRAMEGRREY